MIVTLRAHEHFRLIAIFMNNLKKLVIYIFIIEVNTEITNRHIDKLS